MITLFWSKQHFDATHLCYLQPCQESTQFHPANFRIRLILQNDPKQKFISFDNVCEVENIAAAFGSKRFASKRRRQTQTTQARRPQIAARRSGPMACPRAFNHRLSTETNQLPATTSSLLLNAISIIGLLEVSDVRLVWESEGLVCTWRSHLRLRTSRFYDDGSVADYRYQSFCQR